MKYIYISHYSLGDRNIFLIINIVYVIYIYGFHP